MEWIKTDQPELQESVRSKWLRKDAVAENAFHKFFLILFLLIRVTLLVWVFAGTHVILQLIIALLFEKLARHLHVGGDYVAYDFNVWHKSDPWATFIQIGIWLFGSVTGSIVMTAADIVSILLLHFVEIWLPGKRSGWYGVKVFITLTWLAIFSKHHI